MNWFDQNRSPGGMYSEGASNDLPHERGGYDGREGGYGNGSDPYDWREPYGQDSTHNRYGSSAEFTDPVYLDYLRFRQAYTDEMVRRNQAAQAQGMPPPYGDPRSHDAQLFEAWYTQRHAQSAAGQHDHGSAHGAAQGYRDAGQPRAGGSFQDTAQQGGFPPYFGAAQGQGAFGQDPNPASMQGGGGGGFIPPGSRPSWQQPSYGGGRGGPPDPEQYTFGSWVWAYVQGCVWATPITMIGFLSSTIRWSTFDDVGMALLIMLFMAPVFMGMNFAVGSAPTTVAHQILMSGGNRGPVSYAVAGFLSWAIAGFFLSIFTKLSTQGVRARAEEAVEINMLGLTLTAGLAGLVVMYRLWATRIKPLYDYYDDYRDDDRGRRGGGGRGPSWRPNPPRERPRPQERPQSPPPEDDIPFY